MNSLKFPVLLSILFLAGCAANLSVVKNLNFIPGERKLTVVVLPFESKTVKGEEVVNQVREEVTANLQEGNFYLAEISEVDQYLKDSNVSRSEEVLLKLRQNQLPLNEVFNADILVQGRILEWTKTYLGLHSDIELDVELFVFDAKSGKMLAKVRKGVIKNSGITRLPAGYIAAGTAPLAGLKKSVQQNVIHTLTRELSQTLIEFNEKPTI